MVHPQSLFPWLSAGLIALAAKDISAKPFKTVETGDSQAVCLRAAQARWPGDVVKIEFKHRRGVPIYEIEINGNGRTLEFGCDANAGRIIEEEQEVGSPDDPLFKPKAKVGVAEAARAALGVHPGWIVETEFEIEADGGATYEFDIKTDRGGEAKVEVDAATGRITEDEEELYQVGRE